MLGLLDLKRGKVRASNELHIGSLVQQGSNSGVRYASGKDLKRN